MRVQIHLSEHTEEQIREVKKFCERYETSYTEDAVKLRQHFSDLLDEVKRNILRLRHTKQERQPCEGWFQQVASIIMVVSLVMYIFCIY